MTIGRTIAEAFALPSSTGRYAADLFGRHCRVVFLGQPEPVFLAALQRLGGVGPLLVQPRRLGCIAGVERRDGQLFVEVRDRLLQSFDLDFELGDLALQGLQRFAPFGGKASLVDLGDLGRRRRSSTRRCPRDRCRSADRWPWCRRESASCSRRGRRRSVTRSRHRRSTIGPSSPRPCAGHG